VTFVDEPETHPAIPHNAHRILWVITWILFLLGMLAWFVQGANRPLDPIVSPAVVFLHAAF
jgi:hypothetical protein